LRSSISSFEISCSLSLSLVSILLLLVFDVFSLVGAFLFPFFSGFSLLVTSRNGTFSNIIKRN
jgi:hypothetical protein